MVDDFTVVGQVEIIRIQHFGPDGCHLWTMVRTHDRTEEIPAESRTRNPKLRRVFTGWVDFDLSRIGGQTGINPRRNPRSQIASQDTRPDQQRIGMITVDDAA